MTDNSQVAKAGSDGRARRRERNVERVLDALIHLAAEGKLDPSGEEIAERAGVSHRSLYRYFDDRASLQRAAIDRVMDQIAPLLDIADIGTGSLDHRITTFVAARTETYWAFGPIARTAFSGTWDVVREGIESSRSALHDQLVQQFAAELDMLNHSERQRTVAMLDVPFQFEALEYLAGHAGLDRDELVHALESHLRQSLGPLAERLSVFE
ncbi:MAG: TetR/AcrR family transcriptional regulator [Ilumatobacter sp.]|nr:TetR/AcrR family transcriptional regulator [Ilumatobacter sp.]